MSNRISSTTSKTSDLHSGLRQSKALVRNRRYEYDREYELVRDELLSFTSAGMTEADPAQLRDRRKRLQFVRSFLHEQQDIDRAAHVVFRSAMWKVEAFGAALERVLNHQLQTIAAARQRQIQERAMGKRS